MEKLIMKSLIIKPIDKGFSLIEVVVALFILSISAFKKCSAPKSGRSVTRSPPKLTKLEPSGFRSEIDLFVKGRS